MTEMRLDGELWAVIPRERLSRQAAEEMGANLRDQFPDRRWLILGVPAEIVPLTGLDAAYREVLEVLPPSWNLNLYRFDNYAGHVGVQYGATADIKYAEQPYLTVVSSGEKRPDGDKMFTTAEAALAALAVLLRERNA